MQPICDYHMHTPLCGHAVGEPEQYAAQAIKLDLKEIGFSDHLPLLSHEDPKISMNRSQLPLYHKMIENVKKNHDPILRVRIGIEADYLEGYEEQTRNLLASYPYDYVIGSVHFIKDWGFDDPAQRQGWTGKDIDQVYHDYFDLLRKSAQSELFDIMGHVDLVKKFGHRPQEDMSGEVQKTAEVFRDAGVAIEINTAGLRKPVGEMYPAPWMLKVYRKAGVLLTFGSDAHDPKDVGRDFEEALALAQAAGYKKYILFKNRKIEDEQKI